MLQKPSHAADPIQFAAESQKARQRLWLGWFSLVLLLASSTPQFLCMPLIDDAAFWDLQARNVMRGGIQYRDILETNPPGNLLIHVGVRSLLGWSSVALRAFDLAVFAAIIVLLVNWLKKWGLSSVVRVWAATGSVLFYYSMTEWCHCQRDMWMLAPALVALTLRRRQIERSQDASTSGVGIVLWGVAEGMCWAAGLWIKPMIIIPALICWLVSVGQVHRSRIVVQDLIGLLGGGVLLGTVGIVWLHTSGSWPYFVDTFLNWNPQYISAGREYWSAMRFAGTFIRFFPWLLLHLLAVPVAVWSIARSILVSQSEETSIAGVDRTRALFAAFYLAWVAQSFFLQLLFDYVHAPGVLLAIVMLAGAPPLKRPDWRRVAVIAFLALAFLASPVIRSDRLSCWRQCLASGSTPEVRDRLKLLPAPHFQDLRETERYLRQIGIGDQSVTCYNNALVHLYLDLHVRPPTRFVFLEQLFFLFPEQVPSFLENLSKSPQRFVVTDLVAAGLSHDDANEVGPDGPLALPPAFPRELRGNFPWSLPVVHRSGAILVHDASEFAPTQ